jgi:hypothetical protein
MSINVYPSRRRRREHPLRPLLTRPPSELAAGTTRAAGKEGVSPTTASATQQEAGCRRSRVLALSAIYLYVHRIISPFNQWQVLTNDQLKECRLYLHPKNCPAHTNAVQ